MALYVYCDDVSQNICPVEAASAEEACDRVWDRMKVKVTPVQLHLIRNRDDMVSVLKQVARALIRDGVIVETEERCPQCAAFFARFRCSAASHGECDCPRCQGYCTCNERNEQ